jgi:hypothetical protein
MIIVTCENIFFLLAKNCDISLRICANATHPKTLMWMALVLIKNQVSQCMLSNNVIVPMWLRMCIVVWFALAPKSNKRLGRV